MPRGRPNMCGLRSNVYSSPTPEAGGPREDALGHGLLAEQVRVVARQDRRTSVMTRTQGFDHVARRLEEADLRRANMRLRGLARGCRPISQMRVAVHHTGIRAVPWVSIDLSPPCRRGRRVDPRAAIFYLL